MRKLLKKKTNSAGISIAAAFGGAVIILVSLATITVLSVYVMQRRKRNRIMQQNRDLQRRVSTNSGDSNSGIELETRNSVHSI